MATKYLFCSISESKTWPEKLKMSEKGDILVDIKPQVKTSRASSSKTEKTAHKGREKELLKKIDKLYKQDSATEDKNAGNYKIFRNSVSPLFMSACVLHYCCFYNET